MKCRTKGCEKELHLDQEKRGICGMCDWVTSRKFKKSSNKKGADY